jgi:cytochrome P450
MPTTAAVEDAELVAVELFRTTAGHADPYPLYHRLRELAPVHHSDTARAWLLSRYDDCYSALRDPRLGKDFVQRMDATRPWWRERPSLTRFERSMLNVDGPYHTRLRRLVSKAFTFRSVEKLKPTIERMVDDFIEPLAEAGGGDLVGELAFPLPVTVIGELLGVPPADRPQFRQLTTDITAIFEMGATREQFDVADEATRTIDAYFYNLIDEKRGHPTDDMLSSLVSMPEDDRLNDEELVTLATLLFLAGFETTTNLVGNGMVGFFKRPEQMELLRDSPELDANLSDEILRYDGTVQMILRQTKDEFEVDAITIPPGESVFIMLAAGNHDPARFPDPDHIDVTRADIRPLSFGGGIHFCLGAALARAETEIVFRKLLDRFDVIEPDGEIPPHKDRLGLRGMSSLPVVLRSGGRRRAATRTAERPQTREAQPSARQPARGLPPRPSGDADGAWRAAFRRRVEARPAEEHAELDETIALLGRVPLFRACSPAELEQLARTAYPIAFDAGDVLCVEGADAPECYVIAEGQASVTIGDRVVGTAASDDVVGEKGPLSERPRAATVTATTHMLTYAISREHLLQLVNESPAAAAGMRAELERRYGPTDESN